MVREFVHYFILLVIVTCLFGVLVNLKKYCPKKLKKYVFILVLLGILSYTAQFYIGIAVTQTHISYLKPLIFLGDLVSIFIIVICFHIFLRKEKLQFKWAYISMGVATIIFIIAMIYSQSVVKIDKVYGYKLILTNDFIYRMVLIGILVLFAAIMIFYSGYRYSIKIPYLLLLLMVIGAIGENILYIAGIGFFTYPMIFHGLLVLLFCYGMYRVKK